jgi:hypothetical protein
MSMKLRTSNDVFRTGEFEHEAIVVAHQDARVVLEMRHQRGGGS